MKKAIQTFGLLAMVLVLTSFSVPAENINLTKLDNGGMKIPNDGAKKLDFDNGGMKIPNDGAKKLD